MPSVYHHTCASCGVAFTSHARNQKCCSQVCRGDHLRRGSIDNEGYRILRVRGRRVKEHRYVMEQHLGRLLVPSEVIHHLNGDKQDNRIENLQLIARAGDHTKIHVKQYRDEGRKQCQRCGEIKDRSDFHRCLVEGMDRSKQWCKACQGQYSHEHYRARKPHIAEALYIRCLAAATSNARLCDNCSAPLDSVAWCPKCQSLRRPCQEPHSYLLNKKNARFCCNKCKSAYRRRQEATPAAFTGTLFP